MGRLAAALLCSGLAVSSTHVADGRGSSTPRAAILRTLPISAVSLVVDEPDGRVFVIERYRLDRYPGRISVLDARSGVALLPIRFRAGIDSPVVDAPARRLFVPSGGRILVFDTRSDTLVHAVPLRGYLAAMAVAPRLGRVYIATRDGLAATARDRLLLLDARSGAALRTVPIGRGRDLDSIAVDERRGRAFLVGYRSRTVSVLDARAGTLLRTVTLAVHPVAAAAVAATGRVFVTGDSSTNILDASTGAVLRTVPRGGEQIAASSARVFVVGNAGQDLYIFDAHSGALVRTTPLDPAGQGTTAAAGPIIDSGAGRGYLLLWRQVNKEDETNGPEEVAAFDATSGTLGRGVTIGQTAGSALELDARTRRIFALTGTTVVMLDATALSP